MQRQGIDSSGNILAGVGELEEGHKTVYSKASLQGLTNLGTSLQELVGWRKGTRGLIPREALWD